MDEDASRQILGLGQLLMADTCWVQAKAGYEGTAPFDGWARHGRSVHSVQNRVGSSNFSAPASVALLTSYAAR